MQTVAVSAFKARCLRLVARVGETGNPLVVTRNGKPIARVVPFRRTDGVKCLRGSVVRYGDIVTPLGTDWEAQR